VTAKTVPTLNLGQRPCPNISTARGSGIGSRRSDGTIPCQAYASADCRSGRTSAPRRPASPAGKPRLAAHARRLRRQLTVPGGAYHWAPEIPSANVIAGAMPSKCEPANNPGSFFAKWHGLRSAPLGAQHRSRFKLRLSVLRWPACCKNAALALENKEFSCACVNCDTWRRRESTYIAKRYLPRLRPVANGGFFLRNVVRDPRASGGWRRSAANTYSGQFRRARADFLESTEVARLSAS
jgi:hypothetical protein